MKLARWTILLIALVAFACCAVEHESGPPVSLDLASSSEPVASVSAVSGYWLVSSDGGVFNFGDASFYGSTGGLVLNKPVVAVAPTPDGKGYWLVSSDGGVFNFGDAAFYGSTGGLVLNKPVVAMAPTPDGKGYWLVSSDGGVFNFGDAAFYGSTGGLVLNKPVVAMAPTPDGKGYWLVSSDGGVFTFGDAAFYGSTGGMTLNKPVVAMAPTPDGKGYWLVSSDGGVFTFGDASFYGSTGGMTLNKPVVAMAPTPDGKGYWLVSSDGGVFNFGDASFYGSTGGMTLNKPVVAMGESTPTAASTGFGSTGPPTPSAQTITFTSAPPDFAVEGGTYTPTASGGGTGNPVTFSIDASAQGSCTISGGTVTFVSTGTCVIDANEAGNAIYQAAPQVQQSFAIGTPQAITFTSTPPDFAVVGGTYTASASGGATGNPVTFSIDTSARGSCTISGATVTFVSTGTCVIDANQAGNAIYQAAPQVQQSFAVVGAPQTLTFSSSAPTSATVGGATYTPSASSTSGLTPAITVDSSSTSTCSISAGVVRFNGAGTCKLDANQAGNAIYQAAAQVQQSFTVGKGDQTLTFSSSAPTSATVGGATYTPSASSTSGLTPAITVDSSSTSTCSISAGVVSFNGAGTCQLDANQAGNASWDAAPQVSQSFTVGKGDQTLTFSSSAPTSATVGGATYTPSASSTSGLTPAITVDSSSTSTCSISAGVVSFNGAGTCQLDANQAGNANWDAASQVSQSFAVAASSGNTWPSSSSAIQANICSNSSYLQSPYSYDGGATSFTSGQYGLPTFGTGSSQFPNATSGVIVPAGSNTPSWTSNNTVYYFEPGLHTTDDTGFTPGSHSAFVGGYLSSVSPDPEATLDGGGASSTDSLMVNAGADGTLEYLTVQNYTSSSGNSVVGAGNLATGWTYEDDTIGPNEWNSGTSGQNANGGYAIDGGSGTVIEYDCITQNQEGAFNIYGHPDAILTGDVVTHNEISDNGLGKYPDAGSNPNQCGCSGGGKAFWTLNMIITNNYVHDNYNAGIWLDSGNAGADISDNYIASNWGFGIDYEASYNANISDNNLQSNGWASDGSWPSSTYCSTIDPTYECANGAGPSSQQSGNLNAGGMYISGSGGNPNISGSNYSDELLVEGNNFQNNWSSMSVYTNDQRFSGGYQYTQCDPPLQGTNATYYLQTQGFVTDGVTNGTTAITSSGGFLQVCNDESTPGPAIIPSAGWHVYDSAGMIPANDTISSCVSVHSCTLTTAATGSTTGDYIQASPTGGCGMADLAGTAQGNDYWDNCLFGTFNVTVSSNNFAMASNSVTGCTSASRCGEVDLINYAAGFPSSVFDIYNSESYGCTVGTNTFDGYYACNMMLATSPLDNVFRDNSYTWSGSAASGSWQFRVGPNNGHTISHAVWTGSGSGDLDQDVGSSGL